ncbi:hypothetical protein GCM10009755_13350 [Brevibacterium samyangense]|uniref:Prevent-host-death protein n=2 Tax=Brevibacterium samyangense TaxID=366888 RepID=A0ABN2TD01_9MICO
MDALEAGESYAVTRDGRVIGHLVPEQGPRTFVSRSLFADLFSAPGPDLELFRRHTRDHLSDDVIDPYERS